VSIAGPPRARLHYFDKGILATIGRSRAIAEAPKPGYDSTQR
jgi:hypothetical protein